MEKKDNNVDEVIHSPHDYFIQSSLSRVEVAKDFLKAHLPEDIAKMTNFDTLKLCSKTFISKRFKKYEADIIYQAVVNEQISYFYLLIEAQSTIDKEEPFRLLGYQLEIIRYHRDKLGLKGFPIVYPIVLYTGDQEYTGPRTFASLFEGNEELAEKLLVDKFLLVDIKRTPDEEFKKYPYAGLIEAVLKYAKARDSINHLRDMIIELRDWLAELGFPVLYDILNYLVQMLNYSGVDELEEVIKNHFSQEVKTNIMGTIAEMWMEQGIQKGIEQGIEQGIEKGIEKGIQQGVGKGQLKEKYFIVKQLLAENADVDFIARITKLTTKEIQALREKKDLDLHESALAVEKDKNLNQEMSEWDITIHDGLTEND